MKKICIQRQNIIQVQVENKDKAPNMDNTRLEVITQELEVDKTSQEYLRAREAVATQWYNEGRYPTRKWVDTLGPVSLGALIGTFILPGWGTAVGAALGGFWGLLVQRTDSIRKISRSKEVEAEVDRRILKVNQEVNDEWKAVENSKPENMTLKEEGFRKAANVVTSDKFWDRVSNCKSPSEEKNWKPKNGIGMNKYFTSPSSVSSKAPKPGVSTASSVVRGAPSKVEKSPLKLSKDREDKPFNPPVKSPSSLSSSFVLVDSKVGRSPSLKNLIEPSSLTASESFGDWHLLEKSLLGDVDSFGRTVSEISPDEKKCLSGSSSTKKEANSSVERVDSLLREAYELVPSPSDILREEEQRLMEEGALDSNLIFSSDSDSETESKQPVSPTASTRSDTPSSRSSSTGNITHPSSDVFPTRQPKVQPPEPSLLQRLCLFCSGKTQSKKRVQERDLGCRF